ncbi:MAG: F0F1 ATP synthase subunit epsilon [Corynebacterium sp.]|nr:F0F1 ATP synthase subunit epsilon [Corynebacterium sp.]
MAEIKVELVSVERVLWSGAATLVTAQTTEGEIGILPGHQPLLGQLLENGVVTITPTEGEKRVAAVQGGFLSVTGDIVTILADYAIWSEEVDTTSLEEEVQADDETEKARAEAKMKAVERQANS